jgi:hypothetical protein
MSKYPLLIILLLIIDGCYEKPNVVVCNCHFKDYYDTMLVYDSTELIYLSDEIFSNLNCEYYTHFSIVDVLDSVKWLAGDSTQLIQAYYTKCWDAEIGDEKTVN